MSYDAQTPGPATVQPMHSTAVRRGRPPAYVEPDSASDMGSEGDFEES